MKILAVDTSSSYGSLCLWQDGHLVAEYTTAGVITQSDRILSLIDRLCLDVGWEPMSIGGIGVTSGPGSFTGVRIGLSTALGFSLAAGCPVVTVSTFRALALGVPMARCLLCPVLDARKGEVYGALYRWHGADLVEEFPEQVLAPEVLRRQIHEQVLLLGGSAKILEALLPEELVVSRFFGSVSTPRASVVAGYAEQVLERTPPHLLPPVKPNYLRASSDDLKLRRSFPLSVEGAVG